MSADAQTERLLSPAEVAQYLGIPLQTLYHWRSRGQGPVGMKVGRFVRYDPAEVRAWLQTRRDTRERTDPPAA